MAGDQPLDRLYVCRTCVRDKPLAAGEASRGRRLIEAVQARMAAREPGPEFALRQVNCLNGCLSPCNIALRGQGKYHLRFSRLKPDDAAAVVAMAALYAAASDGDVGKERWPEILQDKLTVRTPPPQLLKT